METTNTNPPLVANTAVRYGLLTAIISVLYSFILIVSSQLGNGTLAWINLLIIPALGIVLAQRDYKNKNAGFMSYGQGLGIGVLLSTVNSVISTLFSYVYREFIDPSIKQQMVDQMRAKMEQAGTMSDEQIDNIIAVSQKFSNGPIGIVIGIATLVLVGTFLTLIISAFIKHTKPEFE